ncbi:MAG TPA: prepilin-type N-terminal cleavage/methylation domain-containing protein [Planctomycetota bacterium]|nr:prepilin-type N-terminal cleavage/methylation domain-containing protein [Planctomycetota bacterium]
MDRSSITGRGRTAFTLVELLVVVVIIGVLAGLIMPAVVWVRRSARSTECKNNLHQLYIALEVYRNAGDGYYPYAALLPSAKLNNLPRIRDVLEKDAGNPKVFKCPADAKGYYDSEGSSYEYNTRLGGERVLRGRFAEILGTTRIPVFYDYEDVHAPKGKPTSRNFVYLDGHVGSSRYAEVVEEEEGE